MSKVWMVTPRGRNKYKYYKTEGAFLEAIGNSDRYVVTIFEEIEFHNNALEYKNNIILQRERENQLSVILDGNKDISTLNQIREEITKMSKEEKFKSNWSVKNLLKKFEAHLNHYQPMMISERYY